ncbi:MAG: alpha/beta hydrolase, partial [Betaproteobacteria bacterium]
MPQNINHRRRDLLSLAAATLAATQFGGIGPSKGETQSDKATTGVRASVGTFAPLKRVEAGLLNVGYAEAGPPDGPAVILLHGWPYDIHSFVEVTPLLAQAGYRVIVPYLR